jgi:hypothetical protein
VQVLNFRALIASKPPPSMFKNTAYKPFQDVAGSSDDVLMVDSSAMIDAAIAIEDENSIAIDAAIVRSGITR